jgi:hypothetical protein
VAGIPQPQFGSGSATEPETDFPEFSVELVEPPITVVNQLMIGDQRPPQIPNPANPILPENGWAWDFWGMPLAATAEAMPPPPPTNGRRRRRKPV